jgi:alkyldihydroxyacetonephosphate synthase
VASAPALSEVRAEPMRWWGWGDPARAPALPAHAIAFLRDTVGVGDSPRPPVALENVHLPASALAEEDLAELRRIAGDDSVIDLIAPPYLP